MAKDAYWFRHDCNAGRDASILEMRSIYKLEGYAIFWLVIEYLREQDGYKLKVGKYGFTPLSGAIGVDQKLLEKFIDDCINEFNLFVMIDGYLTSERLQKDMMIWERNKANGAKGGRPITQTKPKVEPKPNPDHNPELTIKRTERREQREENNTEHTITFKKWFELYDLKQDEIKCEFEWAKLTDEDKSEIENHIEKYIEVTEKKFRPKPLSYLRDRKFMNEIIDRRKPAEIPQDPDRPYNPHS